MKVNLQTIINVCFAISITAFIYQNDKQQDSIAKQQDIIAKLKSDIEFNSKLIGLNKEIQDEINLLHVKIMADNEVNIGIAFDNFDIGKKNLDIADAKIQENSSTLDHIQKYLYENFGKK